MSAAPRIAPAVQELLEQLFDAAHRKHLPAVTLAAMLAGLLDQAGVAAFLQDALRPEQRAALRAELDGFLQREAALLPAQWWSLRSRLARTRTRLSRVGWWHAALSLLQGRGSAPQCDQDIELALMRAVLRRQPPKSVMPADLLVSILENCPGPASAILQRHGVARYALVCHLASIRHPLPAAPQAGLHEARTLRLFLRDDDFTPMQFVIDALQMVCALAPPAASALMQEVHEKGCACCGSFPAPEAFERLRQFEALAAQQQHPLRAYLECGDQDAEALMA